MPIRVPLLPFVPRRRRTRPPTPPPAGPVLVAAVFDAMTFGLTLTFDRGVDVGVLNPAAFAVDDGVAGVRYQGVDMAAHDTPETVLVQVGESGASTAAGVVLDVSSGNGIVAEDDDTPWAGCAGVGLPYP